MNAGEQIRALRDERGLRASDIERLSQALAAKLGNQDYAIPHATLNGIENGSIPTIYKLASLGRVLGVLLNDLLAIYGIDVSAQFGNGEDQFKVTGTHFELRASLQPIGALRVTRGVFHETQIVRREDPIWEALPRGLRGRLAEPDRFAYAIVGVHEDILGEILPGGSFVEIDRAQNKILRFQWRSLSERPIYCLWHGEGHVCCWCEHTGSSLTIVPHPVSRQSVRRLRPRDVTIIGRVVNSWQLPGDQSCT